METRRLTVAPGLVELDDQADLVVQVLQAPDNSQAMVLRAVNARIGGALDTAGTEGAVFALNRLVAEIFRTAYGTADTNVHLRLVDLVFSLARYRDTTNQENERPGTMPDSPLTTAAQLLSELRLFEGEARDRWDDFTVNAARRQLGNLQRFLIALRVQQSRTPIAPLELWLDELVPRRRPAA